MLLSCNKDDSKKNKDGSNENLTFTYSSAEERKEILNKLCVEFISDIYLKKGFDSKFQVAGAVIEENKLEKTLKLKHDIINLENRDYDWLTWAYFGYSLIKKKKSGNNLPEAMSAKTEKLKHTCNGGTNNGRTLILDRPTGFISGTAYAKKVQQFVADCLDGGGCVTVCKAHFIIRLNEETLNFEDELTDDEITPESLEKKRAEYIKDRAEYIKSLDLTENLLLDSLDRKL